MSVSTYLGGYKLPINPLEEVSFIVQGSNKTYNIVKLGEISELGIRKQMTVSVKSLFVKNGQSGLATGCYVNELIDMFDKKQPVRFLIVGGGFDTNLLVSIESFKYSMPYGEDGDVYYTLSLKEYREHRIKKLVIRNTRQSESSSALTDSHDYKEKREEVAANA